MFLEIVGGVVVLMAVMYWYGTHGGHGHGHSHDHGNKGHSHEGNDQKHPRDKQFKKMADNYKEDTHKLYLSKMGVYRKKCLEPLKFIKSKDPALQKEKTIRVVEIGAGPGLNLEYYPNNAKLIVVDPNEHFKEQLDGNLKKYPGVKLEKHLSTGAENMSEIPDNSVDAVVSTLVMCQIKDLPKAYNEINRILAPGGTLLFMDHVADPSWSFHYLCQVIVTRFNLMFGDGGRGDRNIEGIIKQANFKSVEVTRFQLGLDPEDMATVQDKAIMVFKRFHVYGVATAS